MSASTACKHMLATWQGVASTPFEDLSFCEMQIAMLIIDGWQTMEISSSLSLSLKTVGTYRRRVYEKLRVKTYAELARLAFRHDLI